MRNLLTLIIMALSLQGCIFVVGAAAGAAGIAAVYDHRKIEKIAADQKVTNTIVDRLQRDPEISQSDSHIDVTCFNNVVLLTGQATSPELRQQAESIARNTDNVKRVYNELTVEGPTSSLTRTSDSWITTKIKTQMLATKDLQSGTIKVTTENGSVYLMGMVTHQQADMAVQIARKVSGVQKVMKIFQYKD